MNEAKLTLEQFVSLIYSEKIIYFYEYEPMNFDEKTRSYDFSNMELFLAYRSSYKANCMLLPEICKRTIDQIYFDGDAIRVVLDDEETLNKS